MRNRSSFRWNITARYMGRLVFGGKRILTGKVYEEGKALHIDQVLKRAFFLLRGSIIPVTSGFRKTVRGCRDVPTSESRGFLVSRAAICDLGLAAYMTRWRICQILKLTDKGIYNMRKG
jgi:hypothetical protein